MASGTCDGGSPSRARTNSGRATIRRSPPDSIRSARAALESAATSRHAHAAEYGVDENEIYVIGNSSGGHIAALMAMLGDGDFPRTGGWEKARSDIRAAISVAAPYDLNTLSWGNLWAPASGDPQAAHRQASPMFQISANSRPLLVIHSDDDQSVPIQQALAMVKALEAAKVQHKFVRYSDRGHVGLTDEVLQEARTFITALRRGTR